MSALDKAGEPRPLKVLGVISFVNNAGAQQALVRVARQMRARGHEMEVLFLYGVHDVFAGEPNARVLLPKAKPGPLDYATMLVRLVGAVRRSKPDVVLGFLPLGMVAGAVAAKLGGAKAAVASHRSPGPTYGKALRALDRLIGGLGGYRRIVCVSHAVAASFDDYSARYRERLCVVHNGLDSRKTAIGRAAARQLFGLDDADFAYVAAGRLSAQKNYPFFLEQFAKTKRGRLLIAGEGPDRAKIEALLVDLGITDRVALLGDLPKDKVGALLEAADAFVQPSLFEGQSNAVLEAMDAGLAMVLSDVPEQRETLADDDGTLCGLLAPLDDPAAWVRALESLAEDDALRMRLGSAAKSLAERRYSVARMADGFERECRRAHQLAVSGPGAGVGLPGPVAGAGAK